MMQNVVVVTLYMCIIVWTLGVQIKFNNQPEVELEIHCV